MEKMENYKISEEALEGVAGGFKVNKDLVKKALIGTGMIALSIGAGAVSGAGTSYLIDRHTKARKKARGKQAVLDNSGIGDLKNVNMEDFRNLFNPTLGEEEWEEYMMERRIQED